MGPLISTITRRKRLASPLTSFFNPFKETLGCEAALAKAQAELQDSRR